jgi:hypothetical protein
MLFLRLVLGLRKLFIENQGNDPRNGARNENPIWTVLKWDIIHLGGHLVAVSGPLPQKQLGAVLFLQRQVCALLILGRGRAIVVPTKLFMASV